MKPILTNIVVCLFLVVGCASPQIVDKTSLIFGKAYDVAEKGKMKVTVLTPFFKKETVESFPFITTAHVHRGTWAALYTHLPQMPVWEKFTTILIGEQLAKRGIFNLINSYNAEPRISELYLAVVDGEASDIVDLQIKKEEDKFVYINTMLTENIKTGLLPEKTGSLHDFSYSYYNPAMDPILPLIKIANSKVSVAGLALFHKDKYVSKINVEELYFFNLLFPGSTKQMFHEYQIDNSNYASFLNRRSKVSYRFSHMKSSTPQIDITIKLEGDINEYSKGYITSEVVKLMQKKIANEIEKRGIELIKQFQEKQIDPLRISDRWRFQERLEEPKGWQKIYPHAKVNIKVDVKILEIGPNNPKIKD